MSLTVLAPFTQPAAQIAKQRLEEQGHVGYLFHADGAGGLAMEAAVREGRLDAVLDLTLAELAANLVGGPAAAGPDRLTAASLRGIPQVVCFGGLDLVDWGSGASPPKRFLDRQWRRYDGRILLRTNSQENDALGKEIAYKICASSGPVAACMPMGGLSSLDDNRVSHRISEANAALFASFQNWVGPQVRTCVGNYHINDPTFARQAAELLMEMLPTK